jgi:hypothetical protein
VRPCSPLSADQCWQVYLWVALLINLNSEYCFQSHLLRPTNGAPLRVPCDGRSVGRRLDRLV